MDIDLILFALFSLIVTVDFARGGREAIMASKEAETKDNRPRPFVKGIGYLMLTVAVFQLLWLLVIFGTFRGDLARHVATGIFCAVDIVAVVARRRWWNAATHSPPREKDHV